MNDKTQYDMVKNDATCISESDICDGCYDCLLGIDESDKLCHGRLMRNYNDRNVQRHYHGKCNDVTL